MSYLVNCFEMCKSTKGPYNNLYNIDICTGFEEVHSRYKHGNILSTTTLQDVSNLECDLDPHCMTLSMCCKQDGNWDEEISLPSSSHFYLLRVTIKVYLPGN